MDFTDLASDYASTLAEWKEDYTAFKTEQDEAKLAEEIKAAEEYEESLKQEVNHIVCADCLDAMLDYQQKAIFNLVGIVEYLLVLTAKKSNKAERKGLFEALDDIRSAFSVRVD